MSWLGFLNFIVLQWFGVRLAASYEMQRNVTFRDAAAHRYEHQYWIGHYFILRWVWPLTGWWSDYRWIRMERWS